MLIPVTAIIKSGRFLVILRIREKALIGDGGSQVRRKGLLAVMRTNLERLEPMPFRGQLQNYVKFSRDGTLRVKSP